MIISLVAPIAQAQSGSSPVGRLESVIAGPASVTVRGWAVDADTSKPIKVWVTIDNKAARLRVANLRRPDVEGEHGKGPRHGFVVRVKAPPGTHNICVDGVSVGSGENRQIGCAAVSVEARTTDRVARPFGGIDRILSNGSEVNLKGWAIDPDSKRAISVDIYVDGVFVKSVKARKKRRDINRRYDMGKRHGFETSIKLESGAHEVCAHAINDGAGLNQMLGCGTAVTRGEGSRGGPGVVITPTGVVTPVLETHKKGWTVWTPCVDRARISRGTFVAG
ncbi:MAG: hypothetical protein V3V01_18665, partial [Acidimicrobiales bacterium]